MKVNMKKMKFGHDPRNLTSHKEIMVVAKKVMETHAPIFEKLAKVEAQELVLPIPEKTVIVETRTQVLKESRDKWVRKHTKLSRQKMEAAVDQLSETLEQQNERIHFLQHQNKLILELSEKQSFDINALRMQKPKEIHRVTEKHIETAVKSEVPKMVWILLGISLLTNMYILTIK